MSSLRIFEEEGRFLYVVSQVLLCHNPGRRRPNPYNNMQERKAR